VAERNSAAIQGYLEAPLPDAGAAWREVDFTVIDLETTGLDPSSDEIISFATVTVTGGRVRLDDAVYDFVRPRRMPEGETIRIHGLREADLAEAPPLEEVLDDLLEALTGRAMVAHVAAVERSFLGAALAEHGLELRNPIVDTALLDSELRRVRREPAANHQPIALGTMAHDLGLPSHRPHHADGDALTTAQAFIALATHLGAVGYQTLGSLAALKHERESVGLLSRLRGRRG
jgi:DNA polymerase-3 subunit epsilon